MNVLDVLESCRDTIEQFLTIDDRCALHQTCKNLFRDPAIAPDLSCLELFGDQPWPGTVLHVSGLFCHIQDPSTWTLPFLYFAMNVWSHHSDPRWQNHLKKCVRGVIKDTAWKIIDPWPFYYIHLGHVGAGSDGSLQIHLRGDGHKSFETIEPNMFHILGQLISVLIRKRITYAKYTIDIHDMKERDCMILKFYEDCLRQNEGHLRIHCECIVYPTDLIAIRNRSEENFQLIRCVMGGSITRTHAQFLRCMEIITQGQHFPRHVPFPWNTDFITYSFIMAR